MNIQTSGKEAALQSMYARLRRQMTPKQWALRAPVIDAVETLKKERNAVILAHNYQVPEIYHTVSDVVGDSLELARRAAETQADVVVMAGVHFMAETVKLLNPDKIVLSPDLAAGCSLADSVTPEDVRKLRQRFPGVPVVTYVNTSAAVKAECDICCTSGNAVKIVESLGVEEVICLPDEYLASYIDRNTKVRVIGGWGRCEVHEQFTVDDVNAYRETHNGDVMVIAHPECAPDVLDTADFVGSTAQMIAFAREKRPNRLLMLTECSMSDNIAAELPDVEFIKPCQACPHMKRITLEKIEASLRELAPRIDIDPVIAARARISVERMLSVR